MSSDQAIESMTESESRRFAEKLQAWGTTLEPKEQNALAAVLWCAQQAGAVAGDQDVAGYFVQSRARSLLAVGGQGAFGNFEIQDLMSTFNQAETLTSSILKKRDDTGNAIIGKV